MNLYITDLDGTLLGDDSRVDSESARIIASLPSDKLFTIATARTPATVDLILPPEIGPHIPAIVITGAALWHRSERRYSDVMEMGPAAAAMAEEAMLACGLAPFTYTIDAPAGMLYAYGRVPEGRPAFSPLTHAEQAFVDERRNLPLKHISLASNPHTCPPLLVFGIGSMDQVEQAAAIVAQKMPEASVSVYGDVFSREKGFIEVFAPGVSKGEAALRLKERLGASRLIAFGDSLNDMALLAAADVAVAVDNAAEKLKQMARVVIGPNTSCSVARYIANENF
ncbi:MAG: Cof-type HAD-IIB family hydrolase [Pseudoflavonifractor sp.]|nr:Cof-type HAD-IIB family hydrolase [Alloprevotella sp.]MCM1117197.1 Cof-type HAD-IIB family hydrolase [Pseudoflavonifractor sp.]